MTALSIHSPAPAAFVSVAEAAHFLGISERLAYELTDQGVLPSTRLGRRKVVPRQALELIVERSMANFDPDHFLVALAGAGDSSDRTNHLHERCAVDESPGPARAISSVGAQGGR